MRQEDYYLQNQNRPKRKRGRRRDEAQPTKRTKVRKRITAGEEGFGRRRSRSPMVKVLRSWAIFLCLLAALAFWGYRAVQSHFAGPEAVASPVQAARDTGMPSLAGPIRWEGPLPDDVARRFMEAKTLEERLGLVRNPSQMEDVMKRFYTEGPGKDEKPSRLTPMVEAASEGKVVKRYALAMEDDSMRMISMAFTESGPALVDFKNYSRFCSHPWSEVLAGKVQSAPEMRVFLHRGDYYNHEFADESRWISFVATSPDLDLPIFLYASKDDPETPAELRNWTADSAAPIRCTLALEALGTSHLKRQFVLKKLLHLDWLEP